MPLGDQLLFTCWNYSNAASSRKPSLTSAHPELAWEVLLKSPHLHMTAQAVRHHTHTPLPCLCWAVSPRAQSLPTVLCAFSPGQCLAQGGCSVNICGRREGRVHIPGREVLGDQGRRAVGQISGFVPDPRNTVGMLVLVHKAQCWQGVTAIPTAGPLLTGPSTSLPVPQGQRRQGTHQQAQPETGGPGPADMVSPLAHGGSGELWEQPGQGWSGTCPF